jgi:hypothetical protein
MKTARMNLCLPVLAVFVGLVGSSVLAPRATADIIKVEGATACGNLTQAIAECSGGSAWQLSTLLQILTQPNILDSLGEGTDVFLVTNNISNTFSFSLNSTGQNGTGVANNAQCQVNGGAASLFNSCSIVDSLGQTTTLGGPQINNLTFPATITFGGSADFGQTFLLEFVSMQGTSNVVPTPEPATLALLGMGLFSLLVTFHWKRKS